MPITMLRHAVSKHLALLPSARTFVAAAGTPRAAMALPVAKADLPRVQAPTLVMLVAPGDADRADSALRRAGLPAALVRDFQPWAGQHVTAYLPDAGPGSPQSVLLVGLGDNVTLDSVRLASSAAVSALRTRGVVEGATLFLPDVAGAPLPDVARAVAQGAVLANYVFYKSDKLTSPPPATTGPPPVSPLLSTLGIAVPPSADVSEAEEAVAEARVMAECTLFARDLANERGDLGHPAFMQHAAERLVTQFQRELSPGRYVVDPEDDSNPLRVTVLDHLQLRMQGLNLLASVGQASKTADMLPRLVTLEYFGDRANPDNKIALVGKGITFDSGGLNLKPTGSIENMHMDKAGAAAVLATARAAAMLRLRVNVVATMALAENAIDSLSLRPNTILRSHKGLTVEVGNTDAEGRLCLADALSFVQAQYRPRVIVDACTLTGSVVVGLGEHVAGLFSNDDEVARALQDSGDATHERVWRMPIMPEHTEALKSRHADLRNIGPNKWGDACVAAAFLQQFVLPTTKWAHVDMAGPAMPSEPAPCMPPGASGFGAQLLTEFLKRRQAPAGR